MANLEYSTEKEQTLQNSNDRIAIRSIPLPPGKRQAWERSMRLITAILLEILEDQEIIESTFERNKHER